MGEAETLIDQTDWATYTVLTGSATHVGDALRDLLSADLDEIDRPYWRIENFVVAQGEIYSSADPTVAVLMASFRDDRPVHVRITVLDLLFLILTGAASEPDQRAEPTLEQRCRDRMRDSIDLLLGEASDPITGPAARDVLIALGRG